MEKPILYIDMDNVLVDFQSGINRLSEETKRKYEGRYDEVPGFFRRMDPMPMAIESIHQLAEKDGMHWPEIRKYPLDCAKKREELSLISPLQENAFSEPVLHRVVLSKIDFELSDEVWKGINDGFAYYWDVELGYGGDIYFDAACNSVARYLLDRYIFFPFNQLERVLEIMFDFIYRIPGVILPDDVPVIPKHKTVAEKV